LIPLLILLGYFFGESIGWLTDVVNGIDLLLTILGIAACACLVFYLVWKKKRSAPHPKKNT
ncbi:MAG TPA: hypothetical protein VLS90_01910, partial [Thermodesulfobacteriota bacterium]|nr:hypothetical protein [Thermodesulfobacteriota bacterium]